MLFENMMNIFKNKSWLLILTDLVQCNEWPSNNNGRLLLLEPTFSGLQEPNVL